MHSITTISRPGLPPILVVEMPAAHTVVVDVFVRAGSAYESPEENGISHLLEHVLLAGTASHRTRAELQRAIDSTGGYLDALTRKEMTEFTFLVAPGEAERALELVGEFMTTATFSTEAVNSEREIVLEEMMTGNYEGAQDPFAELLWGTESVGLPIIGRREVLARLTPEELRAFYRRSYSPENLLVSVAGPVDPEAVADGLSALRGLPPGEGRLRPEPAPPSNGPKLNFERLGGASIEACLMFRAPGWETGTRSSHAAVTLLTQWLQTHIYQHLIGPELPVYYLYAGREVFISEGFIYFYLRVLRDRFEVTLDRLLPEIERLRSSDMSDETLALVKRRTVLAVLAECDDPRAVAYRLGADVLLCGPERASSAEQEIAELEAVTTEEVGALMRQILSPTNLHGVVRGALSWFGERRVRRRLTEWLS